MAVSRSLSSTKPKARRARDRKQERAPVSKSSPYTLPLWLTQAFAQTLATTIMTLLVLVSYYEEFLAIFSGSLGEKKKKTVISNPSPVTLPPATPIRASDAPSDSTLYSPTTVNSNELGFTKKTTLSTSSSSATVAVTAPNEPMRSVDHDEFTGAPSWRALRKPTMEVRHYVELHGFKHERHRVCTEDGYWLDVDRVVSATKQPTKGSMLLMHGLFQSSGVFTSSGPHSMAFHFVRAGYDVWLGNNRCVNKFGQPHVRYSCHDAELWDYSIDELAQHDFPSLLSYVYLHGSPRVGNPGERDADPRRVVFVGHSQGNAQAFHGLRFRPEVGNKIRCFVALAPALYLGPLLKSFPVNLLMNCPHEYFKSIFGVKQFIPIMDVVQRMAPAPMFAYLAYRMFHYLFGWRDHNWDIREKPTYFLFTPRPTAAKALEHWAQSARAGLVVPFNSESDPRAAIYPHSRALTCPVALVYGTADTIIDADALYGDLVKELNKGGKKKSGRGRLVYVDRIEGYEHMDVVWATDARWKVFAPIEELLEGL